MTVRREITRESRDRGVCAFSFSAMNGPCEVLLHGAAGVQAEALARLAAEEAWRIERKYSRYRADSVTAELHRGRGRLQVVDEETADLLDFARECHAISGGRFDITSGVLRQAWRFDGSANVPTPQAVERLLPYIGFERLQWRRPQLLIPPGMELDFGGIGKEYAVDRAFDLVCARHEPGTVLVNFGGDLRAGVAPPDGPWQVGIERPGSEREAALLLDLENTALATSGDAHRYLLKDGRRYGHVLDPRTGWPVADAPRSATVAAANCTEAGVYTTLALLLGADAENFLAEQGLRYWLVR